uniref:Fibronectin type-III domain-containing protein n=1 Tax=Timema genevievae TaxID=629358 RepID=A0A7R9JWI9_TIMGE|nr:unnamed protein product [Timema genevievae]
MQGGAETIRRSMLKKGMTNVLSVAASRQTREARTANLAYASYLFSCHIDTGPGPGAGSNQPPQPFFAPGGLPPGYPPPHFSHGNPMQPGVMGHVPSPGPPGHSPPPHNFHNKDERTKRQYIKLKKKLEQKHHRGGGEGFINSQAATTTTTTPPFSPRRDLMNGMRPRSKDHGMSSVGTSEDGEESSSMHDEEDEERLMVEMLSTVKSPQVAEMNSRSALLHWPPLVLECRHLELGVTESDLRYEVLLSDKGKEGKYKSIYNGIALSCRIQDLRPGTEYSVCVQVHLEELHWPGGIQGSASEPTTFTTPACEPDQPQLPKVMQRNRTSLQLRWNAPVDNGSPITQYILECDEGRGAGFVEVYKAKGKQHNLTKLQASTVYRFRLAAVNEFGRSIYSDIVQTSTSGSPPGPPVSPVLKEASVTKLHLSWQKRVVDEDYTLQMDDRESGHGFLPVYNGRETHYVCQGLRRHSEYKFRLRAHNEEGPSRWSDEVCYRTLPDRPAPPPRPNVKGRIHAQNFKIKWEPPNDRGGADITTYILELNGGSGYEPVYMGPDTECQCDRLTPGTTYQLRVSCISAGGRSESSEPCTVTTEAVCPGKCPPPWVQGKPRATTFSLKWGYPEYDGGAPLSEFEVEMKCPLDSSQRQVYQGKETECVVTDLSPGQTYSFQVRAFNRVGAGPWSDSVEVLSGAAPPDVPREPQVTCRSSHHALVQWVEPASNGAPVTDYKLEMSTTVEQDFATVFHGLSHAHEVKGLMAATAYFFRIQANNSAGWSPYSGVSATVTPPSSPAGIPLPKFVSTPTTVTLSWQEPASHGAEITHYNIDVGDRMLTTGGPELDYTVENLQPDTTYRLRVQAVNSVGVGPFSPVLRAATLRLPPAPPRLECVNVSHNYLKLKWGDGKNPHFIQFTVEMESPRSRDIEICKSSVQLKSPYLIERPVCRFQTVYQGTSHSCKVNRLQELTMYRFRVAATDDAGQGDFSNVEEYTTTIAPPPSLKVNISAPKVTEVQQRSCWAEWGQCKRVGADPVTYQVQLSRSKDPEYRLAYCGADTRVQLTELDPGTEYHVRVCPVRCAASGDLPGAYSSPTSFNTSAPEVVNHTPRTSIAHVSDYVCIRADRELGISARGIEAVNRRGRGQETSWAIQKDQLKEYVYKKVESWRIVMEGEMFLDKQLWRELVLEHPPGKMEEFHDDDVHSFTLHVLLRLVRPSRSVPSSILITCLDHYNIFLCSVTERKPLTDQQWAFIILFAFTVFALIVAAILQQILPVSSR